MTAFFCELKKSRRRWDWLVVAGIPLLVLLWASGGTPASGDEKASYYSSMLYVLPILHTVVMPVGMAALASRLWDAETRGCTAKLLYTLQSRASLYAAKTVLGVVYLTAVVALETAGLLVMGRLSGVTEPLNLSQLVWTAASTLAVDALLFLGGCLLCIRFGQTLLVMGVGLACSLCGLFAAYMPIRFAYFVPFAYFLPLSCVALDWNFETRSGRYYALPFQLPMLALTVALAALLLALGWRAVQNKEV